jgi:hypothetical protein
VSAQCRAPGLLACLQGQVQRGLQGGVLTLGLQATQTGGWFGWFGLSGW